VEKLRSGATALIDATDLVAAAQRVESGVFEEKLSVAAKAEKEVELPDIVIGGVSLSPLLFNIATDEAASIIETLQRLVAELRKGEQSVIHYDFVRAAHTLAGVNRSTGFTDISDLAGALELWLQVCLDTMTPPDILQLNLLEQTINALAEMVNSLRRKQEPKPRPDLITRLQIKKKQLNKALEEEKQKEEIPKEIPKQEQVQNINEISVPDLSVNEIQPLNDEDDLVAYVQRVAQEQASEPLQWQSPEEHSNTETKKAEKSKPEPAQAMPDIAPDNNFFSIDLNDLQIAPESQTKPIQEDIKTPDAEAFAFNFDDMGFAAETPKEEKAVEPEIEFNLQDNYQADPRHQDVALDDELAEAGNKHHVIEPSYSIPEMASLDEINAQLKAPPAAVHDDAVPADAHETKKRAIQDDLDEQLLPIFLEEADELYPQLTSELTDWRSNVDNAGESQNIARKLQRSLHTLKGSARMAGAMRLGELTHRVEDCLDAAVAEGKHDTALLDELEGYFDRIGSALEKLRTGDTSVDVVEQVAKVVAPKKNVVHQAAEQLVENIEERKEAAILRVRSDIVDDLVNEAGEISVARSRMEVELSAFKGGLHDLTSSVLGMRKLVREIEMHAEGQMQARSAVAGDSAEKFDPLEFDRFTRFQELTRFMSESVHDVHTVQQSLLKNLDETSAAMSAQAKLNSILQQSLMSIRMLPFSNISQRLYRIVRQTGKELGKKANLELYGTEIELDRGVLEKMTAPFEHLLRNAIVHGLESPEQRELKGKPPIGNIALTLRQEGNEVVFEFKDDGAGLNTAKIRQKAVEQGLIQATEIISDEKAMLLIFETGLSTATELTEISGRGVGMDVVRSEIKALGGRVEVSSEPDKGASFTIYLPLTLAVMKALMVRAGNEIYAIPSVMVEQVQQVKPDALVELYRTGAVSWQDKSYPLYYLPQLLGDKERVPDSKVYNSILLLRSGDQRIAIHLDELMGNKEVVVKNVGVQLARLPGIAGATVQANGKVVLILNPVPLIPETKEVKKFDAAIIQKPLRKIPVVMIVDDSLTVRKITTRLLTRAGYEVVTAKDGVDALEKLVDITPDIMLLDVEMPRMDGFELTKQLRRDSKTIDLPIIMITSRTADKHKNYAFELGVNGYLGKPYQDEELLENIAQYAPLLESASSL
jgi:chemosensory pili system protein ChpA (sensor histidine kinase/response regulator)